MAKDMRGELRELVLEKCFKLGEFTLASGRKSEYYIDGRLASLDAKGAWLIANLFMESIVKWKAVAVGGLTLGADPIVGAVIAVSHHLGNPMRGFIVRKEAKGHGTGKLVEGVINTGDIVVIVEDVVTTGSSAFKAVNAAREMGANVAGVLALVDREEGGRDAFDKGGLKFEALYTASELKRIAKERQAGK